MRAAIVALLAACGTHAAAPAKPAPLDWAGRSIYFVVTDRFANGDRGNDDPDGFVANRADDKAWHGGDLQGIIDHLDYIAGMGFTGLWITPVVRQHDEHAYHGYWAWDFRAIDPHLGDLGKLRELVAKAHARGIAVMIDTVANHTGRYDYRAKSFPDAAYYHHHGDITNWNDPVQLETYDVSGLNDLDQANPTVHRELLDDVRWLVKESGADGLRVDTVKHVPRTFWAEWAKAAGVFTIGEVLEGRPAFVGAYTHELDAVLDYPLYFAIASVFGKGGSARELGKVFAEDGAYTHPLLDGVFVDNHDQPRFLCAAQGDEARLRLALAFAFTARGLPILYYGTEQSFGDCKANRQDMFDAFDSSKPLYRYIAQLNAIRAATPALRIGSQTERWQDDTAYAFERTSGDSHALVVINLGAEPRTLALHHLHAAGAVLHDRLGHAGDLSIAGDGSATLTIPAHSAAAFTK